MSYIEELQTWANERVAEYERNRQQALNNSPTVLGKFKSKTSKAMYTVTTHLGNIRCNCPGFTFRRNCKHTKEMV